MTQNSERKSDIRPIFVTVRDEKFKLAKEGDPLFTIDEANQYIMGAGDNEEVLAFLGGNLGLIDRQDGEYWDGKTLPPEYVDETSSS